MDCKTFNTLTILTTLCLGIILAFSVAFDLHFFPIIGFVAGMITFYILGNMKRKTRSKKERKLFLREWIATHTILVYGLCATGFGTILIALQNNFSPFIVVMGYSLTYTAYLVFLVFFATYVLHGGLENENYKKIKKA